MTPGYPSNDLVRHLVPVFLRDFPELDVHTDLDLCDEAAPAEGHGGDQRLSRVEKTAHRRAELRREAFHPADLVHEVNVRGVVEGERFLGDLVEPRDVHAVAAHSVARIEIHVSEQFFVACERRQLEADPATRSSDLVGHEAANSPARQGGGNLINDRRLAGAGYADEQQRLGIVLHDVLHAR